MFLLVSFKIISHTADIGFAIEDNSPEGVILDAISALFSVILGDDYGKEGLFLGTSKELELHLKAGSLDILLHDILEELLFLFSTKSIVPVGTRKIQLDVSNVFVSIVLEFKKVNVSKLSDITEVKAVTYHKLEFSKRGEVWQAKVILDI